MRVLVVTWEYPPLVHGGLGRHVHGLAGTLAAQGHEVAVVAPRAGGQASEVDDEVAGEVAGEVDEEVVSGVRVLRVAPGPPRSTTDDLVAAVLGLGHALTRRGLQLVDAWRPDVVHAHDWVTAHAGRNLSAATGAPLVATIHATEVGLWRGWITSALSEARHEVEGWLVRQAARTIVCSAAMRAEVARALAVPADGLDVVPNAVDALAWRTTPEARLQARHRFGIRPDDPLLVLPGRVEWEKGGLDAVEALVSLRRHRPGTRLVLVGGGSLEGQVRDLASRRGVADSVVLAGRISDSDLAGLVAAADVVLVPSSYEPFGMVALEALAAGTPVVAAASGGLTEVVEDGVSGLLVPPEDPTALAAAVEKVLADPGLQDALTVAGHDRVARRYTWARLAVATNDVYVAAVAHPRPRPFAALPGLPPGPPYRNVLTGELSGA